MNKSFLIKFIGSFLITLGLLFLTGEVFLKTSPISQEKGNILSMVQERLKPANNCQYSEAIDYLYYKDSTWDKNNKFGLYIYAENRNYFELAQNLVNSNGGDWGYVLIPFNVKDRDFDRWDRVFEQTRNKHLIPIIQLWDVDTDDYKDQTVEAAKFLNNFIWPIKERYISVYNEVNDARFWNNKIDPAQYAEILNFTIDQFKKQNPNYFMLNGAFNVSASNSANHMDSFQFMSEMNKARPGIFNKLDGWASHSYPQPNFSGNPDAKGRWSIRAYEDELDYLKNTLGVKKALPVFITETGWAHAEGKDYDPGFYSDEQIAEYYKIAFEDVWLPDDRVRAVTPFTVKYEAPFDHFSWINADNVPYEHYDLVKSLKKVSGNPPHFDTASVKVSGCQ